MPKDKLFRIYAQTLQARINCFQNDNWVWFEKHTLKLNRYNKFLPHGSGIDAKCEIDVDYSKPNRIVIVFDYHFMDDNGFYDGWESYKVIITPTLTDDFNLNIIGKNKRDIKDYFYELFDSILRSEIEIIPAD